MLLPTATCPGASVISNFSRALLLKQSASARVAWHHSFAREGMFAH
jgi:hypothetical protein